MQFLDDLVSSTAQQILADKVVDDRMVVRTTLIILFVLFRDKIVFEDMLAKACTHVGHRTFSWCLVRGASGAKMASPVESVHVISFSWDCAFPK